MPATAPHPIHPSGRRPLRWLRACGVALGLSGLLGAGALAQGQGQDLNALSAQWLESALPQQEQSHSLPLRMEVQIGQLDPRLNLAPCQQVEPYLPTGSKLWGRTRLGLRCVQGERPWNVFLPLTVRAWGPAWVLAHNVNAGELLTPGSAIQSEVDWAAEQSPIIALSEDWIGQTAARHLRAGQALRQALVRPPEVFKKGATVRVLAHGSGFTLTASGIALTGAGIGQSVRIRMDNGRLVSGTVNPQGDVEVNF